MSKDLLATIDRANNIGSRPQEAPAAAMDDGPIIVQKRVPVLGEDTADTLAARVLNQEHIAYPEAIDIVIKNLNKS